MGRLHITAESIHPARLTADNFLRRMLLIALKDGADRIQFQRVDEDTQFLARVDGQELECVPPPAQWVDEMVVEILHLEPFWKRLANWWEQLGTKGADRHPHGYIDITVGERTARIGYAILYQSTGVQIGFELQADPKLAEEIVSLWAENDKREDTSIVDQ